MTPAVGPTLRAWLVRLVRLVVAAAILGALLGLLTSWRVGPRFTATDRLLVTWSAEKDQARKDRLLTYMYDRGLATGARDLEFFLPLVLPAVARQGSDADFDALVAAAPESFKQTSGFLQAMVESLGVFMRAHRFTEAKKQIDLNRRYWEQNEFVKAASEDYLQMLAAVEHSWEVSRTLAAIEPAIADGSIAITDPRFDRLEDLLRHPPALSPTARNGLHTIYPQGGNEPYLFFGRYLAFVPGMMDRFGAAIVAYIDRFDETGLAASGYNSSLLGLQADPALWPEWQRFADRLAAASNVGLQCVAAYSHAYLRAARDGRVADAERLLTAGVIDRPECGDVLRRNAEFIVREAQRDPRNLPNLRLDRMTAP